jgi:hypothetical protein
MKSCHIIAPLSVAISIPVGVVLALPCCMCWDSPNPKFYMKLLGYSGLAVIPVAATLGVVSLILGDKRPLTLNALPYIGVATAFAIGAIVEKKEQEQCDNL